jgi:uncharacterized membrane protein YozB (DUF420 family)
MPDAPISFLPTLNAILNLISVFFLIVGRRSIKKGDTSGHWKNMTKALCASGLFLASYLYYHFFVLQGSMRYEGGAFLRFIYLLILIPHIILAVAQLPFIIAAVITALKKNFVTHVRITKKLWPVWLYVNITGVLVYLMLYVFPHG